MGKPRKGRHSEAPDFSHRPFDALASLLRGRKSAKAVDAPPKTEPPPPGDDDLFAEAMADVREIPEFRSLPVRSRRRLPSTAAKRVEPDAIRLLKEITEGKQPLQLENMQEFVSWLHPQAFRAYPATLLQHLHQGTYSVQDFLDLHGMTVEAAETAIDSFLRRALTMHFRCVKIIHGRGLRSAEGPVLKERLVTLLQTRHAKHVVAFVTARPNDGGLGAVYVLLRRKAFGK